MSNVLIAVAAILVSWLLIVPALIGVGLLLRRIYGLIEIRINDVIISFWVGFAVLIAFGQIWHLFFAADLRIWLVVSILSASGVFLSRDALRKLIVCGEMKWRIGVAIFLLFFVFAIWIALSSSQKQPINDTGIYHLPAILWSHSHPIVPGLSHLHSRLGFNSSLFVYAASLSEGIWTGRPHHIAMGPLLLMLLATAVTNATRLYLYPSKWIANIVPVTFFAPGFHMLLERNYAASCSPNVAMAVLVLIGAWQATVVITAKDPSRREIQYSAFCGALLLTVAATIKITISVFAGLTWFVLLYYCMRGKSQFSKKYFLSPVIWILLSTFILVGPWVFRGIMLSGYPIYPMAIAPIEVEWRVSKEQAEIEASWARDYSRRSLQHPARGISWIPNWAQISSRNTDIVLPALIVLVSSVIVLVFYFQGRWVDLIESERRSIWIIWITIVSLIVWFGTAPDPRFAIGLIWFFTGMTVSISFAMMGEKVPKKLRYSILGIVVLLGIVVVSDISRIIPKEVNSSIHPNAEEGLMERLNRGLAPLPSIPMKKYVTSSGLELNVPVEGNQVWAAPLLSTPHPSPNVKLRNPDDISDGFISIGPWDPYSFPNPNKLVYHEYIRKRLGLGLQTR